MIHSQRLEPGLRHLALGHEAVGELLVAIRGGTRAAAGREPLQVEGLVAAGRIWDNHPMIVTTLLGAKAPASTDETAGLIQGPMPEPG